MRPSRSRFSEDVGFNSSTVLAPNITMFLSISALRGIDGAFDTGLAGGRRRVSKRATNENEVDAQSECLENVSATAWSS
jgi:hypothetical protein